MEAYGRQRAAMKLRIARKVGKKTMLTQKLARGSTAARGCARITRRILTTLNRIGRA